ncbi:Chromobox protein-like protein 3 [Frankliniella fusca]|uniref:Chromobox protein-like protein 3 n=1 Tax=Frankliniella fusca TaxID=407009 RepID=A0AAE1H6E0_9NEOP|nr:Chromobox protein-like protein 3 [Frankliniella fusca]
MRRYTKVKAAADLEESKVNNKRKAAKKEAEHGDDADAEGGEVLSKTPSAADVKESKVNNKRKAAKKETEHGDDAEGGGVLSKTPSAAPDTNDDLNGDQSDSENFEVEFILGSRVRHGKQQFKIRWKGYGPADDTWEDEENVDSPDLIAAYLRGSPDEDKNKKSPKKNSKPPPRKKGRKRTTAEPKEKPAKKLKPNNDDENTEWEVSKIVDYVELKDGTRQFLVRWKGFSAKENTWEPEANLNCSDLIEKFLAQEKKKDESTRETREVRKQVYKYSPEIAKRSSHRISTKKSDGDSSVDGPINITTHSYHQFGDSSQPSLSYHKSDVSSWPRSRSSYKLSSSDSSAWYSKLSSNCVVM